MSQAPQAPAANPLPHIGGLDDRAAHTIDPTVVAAFRQSLESVHELDLGEREPLVYIVFSDTET